MGYWSPENVAARSYLLDASSKRRSEDAKLAPWPWCPRCEAAIESPAEGWRCPECEAQLTPSAEELGRRGGLS